MNTLEVKILIDWVISVPAGSIEAKVKARREEKEVIFTQNISRKINLNLSYNSQLASIKYLWST